MTPERWQKIDAIFRAAVRLDGDERLAYVKKACHGDPALRAEVGSMLAADRTGGVLDGSALDSFVTQELVSAVGEWVESPKPAPVRPIAAQPTRGRLPEQGRVDPVVGWLVCVKGPDLGRDFRIRSEQNRIGRDSLMDICVPGDKRISRNTHATITYDPRHNQFRLAPGRARGIVYLNGRSLDAPAPLRSYDMIELGETRLQFVPFCGEDFKWK